MYQDERVAGSWPTLLARLEARSALQQWSRSEPSFAGLSIDAMVRSLQPTANKTRADTLMAALVRLAAADGGDDEDAVLLLLHVLSPAVTAMAARYVDLAPDILAVIVGELAAQIRSFPWRRRRRAVAANLMLDTRSVVVRELCPRYAHGSRHGEDIPVDPNGPFMRSLDNPAPSRESEPGVLLKDLLAWAAARGIARRIDLDLLVELEECRQGDGSPRLKVAFAHGISEKTVRRRRDRALAALREARGQFLAMAA